MCCGNTVNGADTATGVRRLNEDPREVGGMEED